MINNKNETFTVEALQFRFFKENCCEMKLPSGKTLLIDPLLPDPNGEYDAMTRRFVSGKTAKDLEGCDYVFITHTHFDHILSIPDVMERFNPRIIVNAYSAAALAQYYGLFINRMCVTEHGGEYDFGDFKLLTIRGTHNTDRGKQVFKFNSLGMDGDKGMSELNALGGLFNQNFLLTLPNNLRIVYDSGDYEASLSNWKQYHPNIIFRRYEKQILDDHIENMAQVLLDTGAQFMFPLGLLDIKGSDRDAESMEYVEKVNAVLEKKCAYGRMIYPMPGQWYSLGSTISARQ